MRDITLNNGTRLGEGHPTWIVAEIGLCHNGSLDMALEMIRQCADAGADAVKFQKRDVDNLAVASVLDAPDDRFPAFGKTYREVRRHIEFDVEQYRALQKQAEACGVAFFSSVFDRVSADQLLPLGMPAFKLASHCLTNTPFMEHMAGLGVPVLLSTGMAFLEEVDQAVAVLRAGGARFALYHCVSEYPHTPDRANLRMISRLAERYGVPVGYSSHETDNFSACLAVAMGAATIEKHVTLDRGQQGFDHKIALDMDGLRDLVRGVRLVEQALGSGEKVVSDQEWVTRRKYHSSLVSTRPLTAGEVLGEDMITTKNPGTGIPANRIREAVGRVLRTDIEADAILQWDMLSD